MFIFIYLCHYLCIFHFCVCDLNPNVQLSYILLFCFFRSAWDRHCAPHSSSRNTSAESSPSSAHLDLRLERLCLLFMLLFIYVLLHRHICILIGLYANRQKALCLLRFQTHVRRGTNCVYMYIYIYIIVCVCMYVYTHIHTQVYI